MCVCTGCVDTYCSLISPCTFQSLRRGSSVFAGKHGFITLRDLFRWAERYRLEEQAEATQDWLQHLADDGESHQTWGPASCRGWLAEQSVWVQATCCWLDGSGSRRRRPSSWTPCRSTSNGRWTPTACSPRNSSSVSSVSSSHLTLQAQAVTLPHKQSLLLVLHLLCRENIFDGKYRP